MPGGGGVISHQFVQGSRGGGVRGAPDSACGSGHVSCLSSHVFAASQPGLSVRPARNGLNPGGHGVFPVTGQLMWDAVPRRNPTWIMFRPVAAQSFTSSRPPCLMA
ncbi:hypothetical protein NDU88_002793 [Pleurodeles waltl]|uniref:Uncharacterized protein n=1 Tax=Pleurodeles waltl TaxID=8319 RepID=A0AAV7SEJ5_PLEWA|nr:hypothetical protein NDU88_002793 [Pleurodeles waltl]